MYLQHLGRVALRRWPLVILAVLITAAGLFGVASKMQPNYRSTASVVLIPPKSVEEPQSNRYLELGSLDQAVGVVVRSLTSEQTQAVVKQKAPAGKYTVIADWNTSAPILLITSDGHTLAGTEAVLNAATAQIPIVLQQLQTSIGIDPTEEITSLPLTHDKKPALVLKPLIRAMIAAGVFLLAMCLGLIAIIDGLVVRRSRRKASPAGALADDQADEEELEAESRTSPRAEPRRELETEPETVLEPGQIVAEADPQAAPEAATDTEPAAASTEAPAASSSLRRRLRNRDGRPGVTPLHHPVRSWDGASDREASAEDSSESRAAG
jgi:hypothetical protein